MRSTMRMKLIAACAALIVGGAAHAQESISQTMKIYVFPKQGQDAQQQSIDEAECYTGAVDASGTDPFELAAQAQQAAAQSQQAAAQASQVGKGSGAGGAVGGAAVGAVGGGISNSGSAGKGAAIGAVTGGLVARRQGKKAKAQAEAQVAQQTEQMQQATAQQMTNFKNAFAACIEAREYIARF